MSTIPAAWARLVTVSWVADCTVSAVPGVPPKVAALVPVRFVPVTVTTVPPAVAPTGGSTAGGTVVTVTGTNLTGTSAATFGGTPGTALTVQSATQLTVTSPAHAAGIVDIQVTTPGGTTATGSADKYTYTTPCARTTVHVNGTLSSNTTWSPECVTAYLVETSVVVPTGVTLTIAAGTVVKFAQQGGTGLSVAGKLIAHGAASSQIILTSYKDDSVAGDTNSDGDSTAPAPFDWAGITNYYNTDVGTLDLDNVTIRYSGNAITTTTTAATVTNSTFTDNMGPAIFVYGNGGGNGRLDPMMDAGNTATGNGINGIAVDAVAG